MRPALQRFAVDMERVLSLRLENDHKGGWTHTPLKYLHNRLLQEIGEYFGNEAEGNYDEDELVDIANFAMMIWDKRHQK